MTVIVGSARVDEKGEYIGGKAGDQKQKSTTNDIIGEVSMQNFYLHRKGWYILRAKDESHRAKLAKAMQTACNNPNIGYSQSERLGVVKHGVHTSTPTNTDCSALVRACIKEACGKDVGNFTTYNEANILESSGLFEKRIRYSSQSSTPLLTGDVLVTCSKGHTVIVVQGQNVSTVTYYPKYTGTSLSIVQALKDVGEKDWSFAHRKKIAEANNIKNYKGTAPQNVQLVTLIKDGKLKKA